jgi:serine/threonine protein kinase
VGDHPNVLPLIHMYLTPIGQANFREVYMVYPYHDSFAEKIPRENIQWRPEMLKRFFFQGLLALRHLHASGIIHRNIVPWSFYAIAPSATVKLSNFKHARGVYNASDPDRTPEEMFLREQVGRSSYMAPEMLLGLPYNEKADLWSFACSMLSLLGGAEWVHGNTIEAALGDIASRYVGFSMLWEDKPLPPQVAERVRRLEGWNIPGNENSIRSVFDLGNILPTEMMGIIQKMLAINPSERISAAKAVNDRYFDDIRMLFDESDDLMSHGRYNIKFEEEQTRYGLENTDMIKLRDAIKHIADGFKLKRVVVPMEPLARVPFERNTERQVAAGTATLFPFLENQNRRELPRMNVQEDVLVRAEEVLDRANVQPNVRNEQQDAAQRGHIIARRHLFEIDSRMQGPPRVPQPPEEGEERNSRKRERLAYGRGIVNPSVRQPPEEFANIFDEGSAITDVPNIEEVIEH